MTDEEQATINSELIVAKADAWDEGYVACAVDDGDVDPTENHYREATE